MCGAVAALVLAVGAGELRADEASDSQGLDSYKRLSLDELMNLEITSVSKHAQKLSETPAALEVISAEDIRRSGATSIPEALRLASNLQVARVNASEWAISARGFNNVLANKMLVMIDGRSVYTPLDAGVFWDTQDVLLEDVERIEVVSGPGGTVWGANAVNGVIHVITRNADASHGSLVTAGAGTEEHAFMGLRQGGTLAGLHYRVYGKAFDRGSTLLLDGTDSHDRWHMGQGGFRIDAGTSGGEPGDAFTFQGDWYNGRPRPQGGGRTTLTGGNLNGRWTRTLSENSELQLQLYYDRAQRDFGNGFAEDLATYDFDWQHRFPLGERHELTWGLGARLLDDAFDNLSNFGFDPEKKKFALYSAFAQDQLGWWDGRLKLTLGSKLEHNDYTGVEWQPSARLAWRASSRQTVWAALSRAVRTPSRIDTDFFADIAPGVPLFIGDEGFRSEKVLSHELGWRAQLHSRLSVSTTLFYNRYHDVRSAEPGAPFPIRIDNGVGGPTYGGELSAVLEAAPWWRLRGGYTFLRKHLHRQSGSLDLNNATAESDDPEHALLLQSSFDLPGRVGLDTFLRYVDALPQPHVHSRFELDVALHWQATPRLALSLVGTNLLHRTHQEFIPAASSPPRRIERSVLGKVTWAY